MELVELLIVCAARRPLIHRLSAKTDAPLRWLAAAVPQQPRVMVAIPTGLVLSDWYWINSLSTCTNPFV